MKTDNSSSTIKEGWSSFRLSDTLIVFIVFIVIFSTFSIISRYFLTIDNISSILRNTAVSGMLAVGLTPLMISRGLDISVGSNLSFCAVFMSYLYNQGINLYVCLFIGLICASLIGLLNGLIIEKFELNPLLFTLGTMGVFQGLALVVSNSKSILFLTDELYIFATKSFLKIPIVDWVWILFIVVFITTMRLSKMGMWIYAIGGNTEVAKLFGIRVKRIRILLYFTAGFMTGIAAILAVSLTGVGNPFMGSDLLIPALTAILLGGISLTGGSGRITGSILGVLVMAVVFNGLSIINLPSAFIRIVQGILLMLVVSSYEIRKKRI